MKMKVLFCIFALFVHTLNAEFCKKHIKDTPIPGEKTRIANEAKQVAKEVKHCVESWTGTDPEIMDKYTAEEMAKICGRVEMWRERAVNVANLPMDDNGTLPHPDNDLTTDQRLYWHKLRDCRGKECLKNVVISTNEKRALRKEYRAMTDPERRAFHNAVRKLHDTCVDGASQYEILTHVHKPKYAPAAHGGPAFLPFHREFLKQFELALRHVDPQVGLPYWDSSLDQQLPNPADSIMWTDDFMGNVDGKVESGPFKNWPAAEDSDNPQHGPWLSRGMTGDHAKKKLYEPIDVEFAFSRTSFGDFSWCYSKRFEGDHNAVHVALRGQMDNIPTAPNDPIFWMHHAFVDYMWEYFRTTRQLPDERETDYPSDNPKCKGYEFHSRNADMRPFILENVHGLSNVYTNELYQYQPRPICKPDGAGCVPASPYLFCDTRSNSTRTWSCVSKVKPGGNCTEFEGQDVCFKSTCKDGLCVM